MYRNSSKSVEWLPRVCRVAERRVEDLHYCFCERKTYRANPTRALVPLYLVVLRVVCVMVT